MSESLPPFILPFNDRGDWDFVTSNLAKGPTNTHQELCKLIETFADRFDMGCCVRRSDGLPGLVAAIDFLDAAHRVNFCESVFPRVTAWALDLPRLFSGDARIPVLQAHRDRTVELSCEQVRSVLSHALLCTMPEYRPPKGTRVRFGSFGSISMSGVFGSPLKTAVERSKCFLNYFYAMARGFPVDGTIKFSRRCTAWKPPAWESCDSGLCSVEFPSDGGGIEDDTGADAGVDFANADLHIGRVTASCTQEEVLFSVKPELFVAMLFSQTMAESEAIVIEGARRFSLYTGYLGTFTFVMPSTPRHEALLSPGAPIQRVIAIDALVHPGASQYARPALLRELRKAFVGFAGSTTIATGAWGGGAFGNDKLLKFLQQILAASAAGARSIHYISFDDSRSQYEATYEAMKAKGLRVCDLFKILNDFKGTSASAFAEHTRLSLQQ